jgi:hypothetical protein
MRNMLHKRNFDYLSPRVIIRVDNTNAYRILVAGYKEGGRIVMSRILGQYGNITWMGKNGKSYKIYGGKCRFVLQD